MIFLGIFSFFSSNSLEFYFILFYFIFFFFLFFN